MKEIIQNLLSSDMLTIVYVLLLIWLFITIYMIVVDRKIKKVEKKLLSKNMIDKV